MSQPDQPPPQKPLADRLAALCFIAGLALLCFTGGVIAEFYKLPPAAVVTNGLEAASAWKERFDETGIFHDPESKADSSDTVRQSEAKGKAGAYYDGYTLITQRNSYSVYLVDMQGKIVHRWDIPFSKIWPSPPQVAHPVGDAHVHVERAELFPNGDIIAVYESRGDTPYGYGMVKVDKDSHVVWTYDQNAHHDFYIDRHSGEIYALIQQFVNDPIPGVEDIPYPSLVDYVAKLSPDGKELWRISMIDAFRNSPYASMLHYTIKHQPWDHLHTNAVMEIEPEDAANFPKFKAGQLLLSIRNMGAIAVLDPETKTIVWATKGEWKGQHAARLMHNGDFMLFDNQGNRRNGSRVLEYNPVTSQVTWSFDSTPEHHFYSALHGSLQELPNHNILVADTTESRVFEITPGGEIVWNYAIPKDNESSGITTAYRYSKDALTFLP